jgi:hypothetical protein
MKMYGEWRYNSTIFDLGIRWRYLDVNNTLCNSIACNTEGYILPSQSMDIKTTTSTETFREWRCSAAEECLTIYHA